MKKQQIEQKFTELDKEISSLWKALEETKEVNLFLANVISKLTDKPIFQITCSYNALNYRAPQYHIQYYWNNKIKTIDTNEQILGAELKAYCDAHFILKSINGFYFLVDMCKGTIVDIPSQLFLSKEMNLTIEGQVLKICPTGSGIIGVYKNGN